MSGGIKLRTVNVGVIGVGAMGENHVRVYHKMEEANLLSVSDVSERALKKIERKWWMVLDYLLGLHLSDDY